MQPGDGGARCPTSATPPADQIGGDVAIGDARRPIAVVRRSRSIEAAEADQGAGAAKLCGSDSAIRSRRRRSQNAATPSADRSRVRISCWRTSGTLPDVGTRRPIAVVWRSDRSRRRRQRTSGTLRSVHQGTRWVGGVRRRRGGRICQFERTTAKSSVLERSIENDRSLALHLLRGLAAACRPDNPYCVSWVCR